MNNLTRDQEEHANWWLKRADYHESIGNPSIAITYRNMAWLILNVDKWAPTATGTALEQGERYVAALKRASKP